ncbi:cobyric acid synthase [Pseudoclavibacter chungangensis]|uniref:Lipid II isoglutaminyl synthase (glutamine-hydrolyzing) subunit GatD n=1 Tax=Pseudoclavibacter chungangensis TaxID=587635 RepID=A0A7J5BQD9_9MICO|nr:cobyric acid synthase [Pseudoclavibacter chungangensis]KAB1655999.1 cobyric acid synthase [Pseudoclavibacter chungangensis]NYJ66448.1 hypothetical protein [Pseudoclavibacter chungangensis]
MTLRIVHLFPRELGINGDVGNVTALVERAREYGIATEVVDVGRGDELPASADLVHIGSGPLSSVELVLPDAVRLGGTLRAWAADGVPFLAIAAGWEVLGRSITTEDGRVLQGAGVFPTRAVRQNVQAVGETVLRTRGGLLAGYVNQNSITQLEDGAASLGEVVKGFGNGGIEQPDLGLEGVVAGSLFGTHLHGTALAMNPGLADRLLTIAVQRQDAGAHLQRPSAGGRLDRIDHFARGSREALMRRVGVAE